MFCWHLLSSSLWVVSITWFLLMSFLQFLEKLIVFQKKLNLQPFRWTSNRHSLAHVFYLHQSANQITTRSKVITKKNGRYVRDISHFPLRLQISYASESKLNTEKEPFCRERVTHFIFSQVKYFCSNLKTISSVFHRVRKLKLDCLQQWIPCRNFA